MTRILHVTRLPPSPSGVALYARDMNEAYAAIGEVETLLMPPNPADSQSFELAFKTWWGIRRRVLHRDETVVSFELAGRGIAETWTAWLLARSGRRVWLTVHDAPTLCGAACMSRGLDRPGFRRLGLALSRTLGRLMERDLLQRAEIVVALSESGARALLDDHGVSREVLALPHVLATGPLVPTEARVFVPGYIGASDSLRPLLHGLTRLPRNWRLVIGATSESVAEATRAEAKNMGVADSIELLGFVDEETLDREFSRAAVVVRWRADGWHSRTASYAVSGPLIRALGRNCAVVTNDRRGAVECLESAGVAFVGDGITGAVEMMEAVVRFANDDQLRDAAAQAGLLHIARDHSPHAVAQRLLEVLQ